MIKTRKLHTFSMIANVKSYTFSRIRIKMAAQIRELRRFFVKYLLLFPLLTITCKMAFLVFLTTFRFLGRLKLPSLFLLLFKENC